jgi:hypothetical protein
LLLTTAHVCQLDELSTILNIVTQGLLSLHQQGNKAPFFMFISREQLEELTALIEDTVEYHCDENISSGEMVWTVVECLAAAKLEELTHA